MSDTIIKALQPVRKILLFDTEQSKASLKKCVVRALKHAGLPTDKNDARFIPFFLRPLSTDERRQVIADAIEAEKPDIVFIDGVRDLVNNFNDLDESNQLIQCLMEFTVNFGCTIVNVLHQNKAKDDSNMRGHLGTELLNKLTDCFEVSKDNGRFVVTCTDSRNVPSGNIAFLIDAEGNFRMDENVSDEKAAKAAARVADIKQALKLCFDKQPDYSYGDLVEAYKLEAAVGDRTAKSRIAEAKDNGFLVVVGAKYQLCTNG